jgi:hypothetical protein
LIYKKYKCLKKPKKKRLRLWGRKKGEHKKGRNDDLRGDEKRGQKKE